MLPIFSGLTKDQLSKKIDARIGYILAAIFLIGAAIFVWGRSNITIQPKDPELIKLGNFASQATLHLFELNPLTYERYQNELDKEFAPNILAQLKTRGVCAKSKEQIKQITEDIDKSNKRCLVRVDSTTFPGQATKDGLVPIEVQGTCIKTAKDISKASRFDISYLIGTSVKTKQPVVAAIDIKKFD